MNEMKLVFKSRLENEVFARTSVVAFLAPLHLSMETLMEIIGKLIAWIVVCALLFAALWLLATAMGFAADAVAALAM